MAAIASSRIAAGSIFQKPQAKDAGAANGTDASSPFQQILSAAATDQVTGSQAPGRGPGKKSAKDFTPDGKTDQAQQPVKDQIATAADSGAAGLVNATQAKDQDTAGDTNSSMSTGNAGDISSTNQNGGASAQQQTAADASQILGAAQTFLLPQASAGKTQDVTNNSGPIAASADPAQETAAMPPGSDTVGNAADASQPSARKPGEDTAKDMSSSLIQAGNVQSDTTETVSSPAPAKDAKPGKPQDAAKDNAKPVDGQATPPDPSAMAVAAVMPPIQTPADPAPAPGQTIAAAAISGAAKGAAKNSGVNSNPGTDTANDNRVNGETAKPGDGNSPPPANAAAQDGTAANAQQSSDGAQTAGNPQTASHSDKASAPAHDQVQAPVPQTQASQPQSQPQTPVAAIQPPAPPQAPAPAPASQHVQVGPQDSSSAANTLSALAVAIAVKSQSGNKQFDIRLDPPELGRVEVRLSIDSSGKAQASLSADQPRTLDLLRTDASTLTRALRDAGLNVSQNGLNFSLRGQDRQNGGSGFAPRSGRASQLSLIATSAVGSVQGGANYQGPADGRLDIRV